MASRKHTNAAAKAKSTPETPTPPPLGPILVFHRSDLIGLAECPASVAGPILHNFVRWFCRMPCQPPKEPLARAISTLMRERQNHLYRTDRGMDVPYPC